MNRLTQVYSTWLAEESGFAASEGGIPTNVGGEYPEVLKAFDGVDFVMDNPAAEGEESLYNDINNNSEIGLNSSNETKQAILEAALRGTRTLDEIMDEWNQKWTDAQESYGVTPEDYDYLQATK